MYRATGWYLVARFCVQETLLLYAGGIMLASFRDRTIAQIQIEGEQIKTA